MITHQFPEMHSFESPVQILEKLESCTIKHFEPRLQAKHIADGKDLNDNWSVKDGFDKATLGSW